MGRHRCGNHLFLGSIFIAKPDVVDDAVVEQIHILKHHRDVRKKAVGFHIFDIASAHPYLPGIDIPEAGNQVRDGGLPGSRRPHHGSDGILRDAKVDALQHIGILIFEPDILELDIEPAQLRVVIGFG